ncbi:MAG: tail fiber assembly protein [Pararobbsia sp.]
MLIHQYDDATGQYLSSRLADPDPRREGRWLEPAFATAEPLIERTANTWPFFREGSWVLLPDFRGRILYRQDNGEAAEIFVPGVTPEDVGLTVAPRPSDEYRWTDGQWTLDAETIARRERAAAMAEFESRMDEARSTNAGKADAYAAGLLDELGVAMFKAWATYQLDLVRVLSALGFPADRSWPVAPVEEQIARQVEIDRQTREAEKAEAERVETEKAVAENNEAENAVLDADDFLTPTDLSR